MMEFGTIKKIECTQTEECDLLREYLASHALDYEDNIDIAIGVFDDNSTLRGCGCAAGKVLKCFAIDDELRGQNLLGPLISQLIRDRFSKRIYDLMVFTRLQNKGIFCNCGFYPVVQTDHLIMLENQKDGPKRFAEALFKQEDCGKTVGAIVMNANPFTLGHRYLVEQACAQCDVLHIFIVEEDRSFFSTEVRYRLACEATADLPKVRVHMGGPYMISSATFPQYFLKTDEDSVSLQCELDIKLFAESLAPVLHITKRFAGTEPFDATTARYNAKMAELLPQYGISFCEVMRMERGGYPISASCVRKFAASSNMFSRALSLVPKATRDYLIRLQEGQA